ncbi:MAG: CinA family nicotinamide mononucleotide deamidase-related protein [Anaerolineales bacterium]
MPTAEIITIGTEILLGEIVDTNSAWLARKLRDLNLNIFRTATVGDNAGRIAEILRETLTRADIIITTGGLGPTVDDPTREAVALAFGRPTEYRPELWQQIVERMARFGRSPGENQKRQAYIPQGGLALTNPVGTAPAFIVAENGKCVISLPGVPREMEYLAENEVFPYLRRAYNLRGLIKARVLHTAGMGESVIDEKIGDLETLANPTVGLAAHAGAVDIRITARAQDEDEANRRIAEIEADLRQRLGSVIYGADDEKLEAVLLALLAARNARLSVVEANSGGKLTRRLSSAAMPQIFAGGKILSEAVSPAELARALQAECAASGAEYGLGLVTRPLPEKLEVDLALLSPAGLKSESRGYGGHPKSLAGWGVTSLLDTLRQSLLAENSSANL